MQQLTDIIPNIISYMEKPISARRVAKEWKKSVDMEAANALKNLRIKYEGSMHTLDRKVYSTIYTKMRQATRAGDTEIIRPIVAYSRYLPINWDLLAFDIAFAPENKWQALYEILSPRWVSFGEDAFYALTEMGHPTFSFYINPHETEDEEEAEEMSFYAEPMSDLIEDNAYGRYLKVLMGLQYIENIEDNLTVASSGKYLALYLNIYPIRYNKDMQEAERELMGNLQRRPTPLSVYSLPIEEIQLYPYPPLFLDIVNAIQLGRSDILDIAYPSDKVLIHDILKYYTIHNESNPLIDDYLMNRIQDWNPIILDIRLPKKFIGKLYMLPIPGIEKVFYSLYYNDIDLFNKVMEMVTLNREQAKEFYRLAQKNRRWNMLKRIKELYPKYF